LKGRRYVSGPVAYGGCGFTITIATVRRAASRFRSSITWVDWGFQGRSTGLVEQQHLRVAASARADCRKPCLLAPESLAAGYPRTVRSEQAGAGWG